MREKYAEQGRNPYDGLRFYSALTHGLGIVLALLALVSLLHLAVAMGSTTRSVTAVSIYALSMIGLYTASTLYHSIDTTIKGRMFLRKLDHVMIYFLIAGTYTPVCAIALQGSLSGKTMLIIIWSMAVLGTVLTLCWIQMPRFLTAAIYLVMGWVAIFAIYPLYSVMNAVEFACLLLGGVLYSVGGVLYALKLPGRDNPNFGCHEIFHVFIVMGSICHFIMVYQLLLKA